MSRVKIGLTIALILSTVIVFAQNPAKEGFDLLYRDQPVKAKTFFENLVNSNPSPENYFYLGNFNLQIRDFEAASKAFEKGIELDSKGDYPLNQVGMAAVLVGKGKVEEAKPKFDKILADTKERDIDVIYRIAEAYEMFYELGQDDKLRNNDPGEALRLIGLLETKISKKFPNLLPEHYEVKGDAFLIMNNGGDAVSAYEQVVRMQPDNLEVKTKIASVYLRGKNYKETQARYKEVLEADSTFAPAIKKYGEYLIIGAQYKNAASFFRKYLKFSEPSPSDILETAKLLFLSKDYQGSMDYTQKAEALGVKDTDISRMKGYSNVELGNYQEGLGNLELMKKEAVKPYYLDDFYFGKAYQGLGQDSLAIVYYDLAAPLDTNNNVYSIIHEIYFKKKDFLNAGKYGEKMISWKNDRKETIGSGDYFRVGLDYYYATAYTDQADSAKRLELGAKSDNFFSSAIEVNPKWPPFYISRARVNRLIDFESKGIWAPFYTDFIRVVNELKAENSSSFKVDDNQLFESYKALGGYYLGIGEDENKADDYFKLALEIKPDDAQILEHFASKEKTEEVGK